MSTIIIDNEGDLLVEVVEWDHEQEWPDRKPIIRKTQHFWVWRQVLKDSSRVFKNMLGGEFRERHQDSIKLQDWTISCIKIWLQALHNVRQDYDVPIEATWHLAKMGEYYGFDILKLKDWFADWYQRQPVDRWYINRESDDVPNPRWLLYPCWIFDHYKGFMKATEFCTYHYCGHITEHNPTRFRDLHLPQRIIQQLNAAKGRLRTVLHKDLYGPNDRLLRATCTCKAESLWGYEKALTDCKAWPLERLVQVTSMAVILERLTRFKYALPSTACSDCRQNYHSVVKGAISHTSGYFDGLCLDCMDSSKTDDEDADYWSHGELKQSDFVYGCRAGRHGQPTWYYSYMGQKQSKDRMNRSVRMSRYDGDLE
ncbi:MAG: hypothetical protein Q9205_005635 [Flavoplaca limonia]